MCKQNCRTFLWGGTGIPAEDGNGGCICVCENERWSNLDILAGASCVPELAHQTVGWAGLVVSAAALGHAAYHLRRQRLFHVQTTGASTSPVEQCRKQLHVTAIILAILSVCYFAMVLGNKLRWSVVLWIAMQFPTHIAGVTLAVRMWVYTNDARSMRQCPRMLATFTWLQTRAGHRVTHGLISTTPVATLLLELLTNTTTAFYVIATGICVITTMGMTSFWVAGTSLMSAIDASLEKKHQKQQQQQQLHSPSVERSNEADAKIRRGTEMLRRYSFGDLSLLAAKKKVQRVLTFVMSMGVVVESIMIFDIFSRYGVAAPLVLLVTPLAVAAPIWYGFNIQMHAGRSNAGRRTSLLRVSLPVSGPFQRNRRSSGRLSSLFFFRIRSHRTHSTQVLPTEARTTLPAE